MLKEKNLPNAKEINKLSRESQGAYEALVNNIIIGIKKITKEGRYEYTHYKKIPLVFTNKLKKWLNDLGYEVIFRKDKETDTYFNISIKWHYPFKNKN